ncbi:ArsR/SmtB family transcription factor [Croceicoccus naphthovorans]|nr:metalloregulator ArsR/SmtB family transcription factor [Croceicoccus naphthovorans]MBB3989844.1 ArsR family transcriptional regulator [Croceicoccus naphthovorans]
MTVHTLIGALDDPTRLRLLRLLARMELAVGELADVLDQSQPRISRHIRILTEAGLVEKRKEGSWVFLRAVSHDSGTMAALSDDLLAVAETEDLEFAATCEADRARLTAIRAAREGIAESWFARHADEWDALRSLHTPDGAVEAELTRLLGVADAHEDPAPLGRLLDIGTGTGRIAELYAPSAAHVTALDKSPEMLRIARARLQHLPPARLNLLQGDFLELPFADETFDTVLFHQVLHYAQDPDRALAEAARVTAPGGRIAIVDFAAHTREDLRRDHAHARLGFADSQIADLLTEAGFTPTEDAALPGAELTVRIWTGKRLGQLHALRRDTDKRKATR